MRGVEFGRRQSLGFETRKVSGGGQSPAAVMHGGGGSQSSMVSP